VFFNPQEIEHRETAAPAATDTAKVAGHTEPNLFVQLLHHTQDAHEIELPGVAVELPYLLFDEGSFHVYRNSESLKEEGRFTIQHEKVVRQSDGLPPALDMSITKHVVFMWVAALILVITAITVAKKNRKSPVPKGIGNLFEVFVVYIRDEIVLPNMGRAGLRYLPFLLTTFFFILIMNLLGLIPYASTATGNVNVTAGLAIIAFFMIQISAIRAQGLGHYLAHLTGGVSWILWPIMIPIEVLGLFTKPFALCIRLFANMTGGHIVIVSLLGMIFLFKSFAIAPVPVAFVLAINMLELFVAFLQAYIFTMLTSLFMGLGLQAAHDAGEAHEEHAH
jgi:F-type H+-transporting ATPase subunit a